MNTVVSLGVSPDRIIYANPCKLPRHLAAVAALGVTITTFDSEAGGYARLHQSCAISDEKHILETP